MDFFLSLSLDLLVVNTFCDDMIFYYIFSFGQNIFTKAKFGVNWRWFPRHETAGLPAQNVAGSLGPWLL